MDEFESDVSNLLAQADALIDIGRFDEAIELARRAGAQSPEDYRPLCVWSRALMGQGNYSEGAALATTATKLAPNVPFVFYVRSIAVGSLANASRDREKIGLGREAVAAAAESIRIAPYFSPGYIALGQAYAILGEFESADAAIKEAIRLAPNDVGTWVGASVIAIRARNWEAAIAASRRALAIEPRNYAALNNLGTAMNAAGDKGGVEVLASAARVDPDQQTARRNISMIGINKIRIAVMIVLIPIGFLTNLGFILYVVFALVSNLLITKYPDVVLRLERWTVPLAMRKARSSPRVGERPTGPPRKGSPSEVAQSGVTDSRPDLGTRPLISDEQFSVLQPEGRRKARYPQPRIHQISTPIVVVLAAAIWMMAATFVALIFISPASGATSMALVAFVCVLFALGLTGVVRRRRGET